ncbi:ATP-binding protein [Desulforhopalus vacuolatus]|uniref:ATP-binding protein n=1 Tax=Desulforhopalus vacuolatus TaxID=40414 RepID=UPI001962681B|nr:DUF499 domain-containing protein [Desulforhopalus vacuolatus]MBM9518991.1 ATP-binding protein [Desulforhopalus vacuolatus]
MSLKPWREIARPHKDVLEGTFKQSEFAADISQVASGTAPAEYQDAEKFFSRTFITEGMRLLLISVVRRLTCQGGDPVIQLQTAFGGGKTHTMLAVMHLALQKVSPDKMEGIPPLLDAAGIHDMPRAKVAVIDGIKLSPSQPQKYGAITANTLWGELAWQLLGEEGYTMVAQSDSDGTSPGKEVLRQLLEKSAPCVVLIDELLAFIRQLEVGQQFKAGTFDSNISFIQALTEAMKLVPNALLLASLPESELEVGGAMGQRTLNSLEKYFARVESVWKPVASTEAFEIVRRRLFEYAGDSSEVEEISRTFFDYYRANSNKFPAETQSNDYFERLCRSYPIHPEVFDRLYEDWSTLDKFQRTRGVLQYMAIVIHHLWNSDNRDAMIMPGSIDLNDSNVRNKSIHYLPQGWEPVIEKEVDGPRSEPASIDGHDTRFGSVQAARRAMRTIFLGSAPTVSSQMVKGILIEHILLGCAQPQQTVGVFEDVLKRLRDKLQYLYSDESRFWLDTKPNLRREMESRKQQINDQEQLTPLLKERVGRLLAGNHCFAGVHVFTSSVDIPDDYGKGPRLVILPPDMFSALSKGDSTNATNAAEEILRHRGEQPRQKQNRLIFFAADFDVLSRLKDYTRTLIAWKEILSDIDNGKLNLDLFQINQAKKQRDVSEQSLQQIIREAYKWILCPVEDIVHGKPQLSWEAVAVSTSSQNLAVEIESRLKEEEWLITEWSPIHLRNLLNQWYFKDGVTEVNVLKVWQDSCNYLYLPRLSNEHVYRSVIEQGLQSEDYFGFASGKEGDNFLGFAFGSAAIAGVDDSSLFIEREAAAEYRNRTKTALSLQTQGQDKSVTDGGNIGTGWQAKPSVDPLVIEESPAATIRRQFYGNINLDPVKSKMDFATIVDEVVERFITKLGVNVTISVEIQARSPDGFDEALQRTIKENCSVLKFGSAEFEE